MFDAVAESRRKSLKWVLIVAGSALSIVITLEVSRWWHSPPSLGYPPRGRDYFIDSFGGPPPPPIAPRLIVEF